MFVSTSYRKSIGDASISRRHLTPTGVAAPIRPLSRPAMQPAIVSDRLSVVSIVEVAVGQWTALQAAGRDSLTTLLATVQCD